MGFKYTSNIFHFFMGGGALALIISCAITIGYDAIYFQENKYMLSIYGVQQTLHLLIILMMTFAVFTIVFLLVYVIFALGNSTSPARVIFLVLWGLMFIALFICQIITVSKTKYGDTVISSIYNYYNTSDEFKEYVDSFYDVEGASFTPPNVSTDFEFDDDIFHYFYVSYTYYSNGDYHSAKVPSCKFDYTGVVEDFSSDNPCDYSFSEFEGTCIGGWSASLLQQYWCSLYNEYKDLSSKNGSDLAGSIAIALRRQQGLLSLGFLRHQLHSAHS